MIVLRWILRLLGAILALAAVASLVASPLEISFRDIARTGGQAGFFLMVAGFVAGWKWESTAGIMILTGYVVFAVANRILFVNWILLLFPIIGIGYLITGRSKGRKKTAMRGKIY